MNRLLFIGLALLMLPTTSHAQRCYSGGCSTGYCGSTLVARSTYSPLAESRLIVREAPVILKEDLLTQQFLNQQLLASASNATFGGQFIGTGLSNVNFGSSQTFAQPSLTGQVQNFAGQQQQQLGLQQQQQAAPNDQSLQQSQEQLRQLQLQRQQLIQQQAQQMAAQGPDPNAPVPTPDGSGIDTLRAEATAAAVEILRKEVADLRRNLTQPTDPVQPFQQPLAPRPAPKANHPMKTMPAAREEARRVALR